MTGLGQSSARATNDTTSTTAAAQPKSHSGIGRLARWIRPCACAPSGSTSMARSSTPAARAAMVARVVPLLMVLPLPLRRRKSTRPAQGARYVTRPGPRTGRAAGAAAPADERRTAREHRPRAAGRTSLAHLGELPVPEGAAGPAAARAGGRRAEPAAAVDHRAAGGLVGLPRHGALLVDARLAPVADA